MDNKKETALIVIDSGFNWDALQKAGRVIGFYDLPADRFYVDAAGLDAEVLSSVAGDPMRHGSIILKRLTELLPEAPLILVRAFNQSNRCMRTVWRNGQIARKGWTEAYREAVAVARQFGMASVANCSFGSYEHAMDGTGWEAFQLGHETGTGKPGHIVVAAAGPGDGRPAHASWYLGRDESVTVNVIQQEDTVYNFWAGLQQDPNSQDGWLMHVSRNGEQLFSVNGSDIPRNIWNDRRQVTFAVHGAGNVELVLSRGGSDAGTVRFDCWVRNDGARFVDHIHPTLISEPAALHNVLSVGLRGKVYSDLQTEPHCRPDVLLPGEGPISFRAPELTAAVARLFMDGDAELDIDGVRTLLGKYPDVLTLASGTRQ